MILAPSDFESSHVHLATPLLVRSGFGWVVSANEHAVWWRQLGRGTTRVALRSPNSSPWQPRRITPSPTGGLVDLGFAAATAEAIYMRSSRGVYGHGPTALLRRHGILQRSLHTEQSMPIAARAGDRRPFPDQAGWVWVDGDTAYRCRPGGHTEAFIRIPGRIGAWDVGPRGAFWCTDGNGLWVASAKNLARRVSTTVLEHLAIDLDELQPGDFVFDDQGTAIALAEAQSTREVRLAGMPSLGRAVDAIVGLSPTPLTFPDPFPAARATSHDGCVVRICAGVMEVWRTPGPPRVASLPTTAHPLAIAGPHQGIVTVLTSAGIHGFTLDGHPAPAQPGSLRDDPCSTHISATDAGDVWWTDDGMVAPLCLGSDITRQ